MIKRPENITVVILSEEEGKELSARYAVRCIGRDFGMLAKALARHVRRYCAKTARGYRHATHWWTREHPHRGR